MPAKSPLLNEAYLSGPQWVQILVFTRVFNGTTGFTVSRICVPLDRQEPGKILKPHITIP